MTDYHRLLAYALIVSGAGLSAAVLVKNKVIHAAVLGVVIITGVIFLSYRHQYNVVAQCRQPGPVHQIILANDHAEPRELRVTLCDRINLVPADNGFYEISFGGHTHHGSYPDFDPTTLSSSKEQQFTVTIAGTFSYHDSLNHKLSGRIVVERPKNLHDWKVLKY